jgi:ornithine carbamoyltransferase
MKHFLAISDLSPAETQDLLDVAIQLKTEYFKKGNPPLFKGKVLGMIFQKPSLRTRVSFDMAMRHCGGDALYLSPNEIGLGKRESIADIARSCQVMCKRLWRARSAYACVNWQVV